MGQVSEWSSEKAWSWCNYSYLWQKTVDIINWFGIRLNLFSKGSAQKPFQDPVSHFEVPWLLYWIFEVFIGGIICFSWTACSNKTNYLAKVDGSAHKPRGKPLFRPCQPFWGPPAVILDEAGSGVSQAVQRFSYWASAPVTARLVFLK